MRYSNETVLFAFLFFSLERLLDSLGVRVMDEPWPRFKHWRERVRHFAKNMALIHPRTHGLTNYVEAARPSRIQGSWSS